MNVLSVVHVQSSIESEFTHLYGIDARYFVRQRRQSRFRFDGRFEAFARTRREIGDVFIQTRTNVKGEYLRVRLQKVHQR